MLVGELILDQKVSKLQTNLKYNFAYMNFQNLELRAYLVAQLVKNRPAMQEIWVQFLGWEECITVNFTNENLSSTTLSHLVTSP